MSHISLQKRQLETTFDENSQKRLHVEDNDFFGLPHKVKHMFKKYQKITQLYGLFLYNNFLIIIMYLMFLLNYKLYNV